MCWVPRYALRVQQFHYPGLEGQNQQGSSRINFCNSYVCINVLEVSWKASLEKPRGFPLIMDMKVFILLMAEQAQKIAYKLASEPIQRIFKILSQVLDCTIIFY